MEKRSDRSRCGSVMAATVVLTARKMRRVRSRGCVGSVRSRGCVGAMAVD